MEESDVKTITIVWVGLVPPVLTFIVFTFILLSLERAKIGHDLMCSALIGRLGHCSLVVTLWSIFTLEHWNWPKETCYILTWAWITFWIGDILNTFFFLVYYTFAYGAKKSGKRMSGFLIMFFTWICSLLIGGLPVFMESSFHNYTPETETCVLDFVKAEQNVKIAAVIVHIIGPLFCFVLCIAINVEFKSIRAKHTLYCRINSLNVEPNKTNESNALSNLTDLVSDKSTAESGSISSSVTTSGSCHANLVNVTSNSLARREVRKCGLVERGNGVQECEYTSNMRDTRNMLNVLTVCTIGLNCSPQLILYILEIASEELAVYTHCILVMVGIIHGYALPILTCVATYRYSSLASKLAKRFFCNREKAKKTQTAQSPENGLSNKHDTESRPTSNIMTVSTIVDSTSINAEETVGTAVIDLDEPTTDQIIPKEQERPSSAAPALPTSRHPSFNNPRSPTILTDSEENRRVQNGHSSPDQRNEDEEGSHQKVQHVHVNQQEPVKEHTDVKSEQNNVVLECEDDTTQHLDMSVQSVDIEALKQSNRPQHHLDIPLLARSNSAVAVSQTNDRQALAIIRRTTSSAHLAAVDKNEGPLVDWNQGPGTLLIRKIQSGDKTYVSCDYHHNAISDGIKLIDEVDDGESYYSEEEDSSYYDSDSAGWSHMYTDTDMDETLERNKEKRNTVKRAAAKRISSNDSSLHNEARRHAKVRKKKKKSKAKSHKSKGKNVEKGLGSALQTMMVMPGAQLTHRPKEVSLDSTKNLGVNTSQDAGKEASQISPAIGPDGQSIDVPLPPKFTPPPPPSETSSKTSSRTSKQPAAGPNTENASHERSSITSQTDDVNPQSPNSSGIVFPSTVLPFQTKYNSGTQSVNEQQSFAKETLVTEHSNHQVHNNPYLGLQALDKANNDAQTSGKSQPNNFHPSIYSIVKERTKAQKAWQKAFTALSVTDFLKKIPSNTGVSENDDNFNEFEDDTEDSRLRNTISRGSAHTYVNTGSSGMFANMKQVSITLNDEQDEFVDL